MGPEFLTTPGEWYAHVASAFPMIHHYLAVLDVVEAMASHRPYRAALGIDQALAEISQNRGNYYDPAVVEVCLKLFAEKDFKFV